MIPKTIKSCNLQLISPCFCAGAHQTEPELRAASFRGELRWWFRCLGGTREQEAAVFGSVHGQCRASAVAILVLNVKPAPDSKWTFEQPGNPKMPNSSYLTYFLSANEKNGGEDKVVRTEAWLPPGQKFTLELRQMRDIDAPNMELLMLAWDCLCNLGAIGTRKTRALGAYAPIETTQQKISELISHQIVCSHFCFKLLDKKDYGVFTDPAATTNMLTDCAIKLKQYRKDIGIHPTLSKGQSQKAGAYYGTSALGNAIDVRQTSAVRFRPVLNNGRLQLLILKAPDITLSDKAAMHNLDKL